MLKKLLAIPKPLIALTAFSDGVICDYMTSEGIGGFELLDWSDLDDHIYGPDRTWDDMDDSELEEWIKLLQDGDFTPFDEFEIDSE